MHADARSCVLIAVLLICGLLVMAGCRDQPPGNAPGTTDVDGLIQTYIDAHNARDIEKLRGVLLWNGPIGGTIRGFRERESELERLFELQLDEVILIEFPKGNLPSGAVQMDYTSDNVMYPGNETTDSILGPFTGKLILKGTVVDADGRRVALELDPALAIRPLNGQQYIFAPQPILGHAETAVVTRRPQASTPEPVPHQTQTVVWTREAGWLGRSNAVASQPATARDSP